MILTLIEYDRGVINPYCLQLLTFVRKLVTKENTQLDIDSDKALDGDEEIETDSARASYAFLCFPCAFPMLSYTLRILFLCFHILCL